MRWKPLRRSIYHSFVARTEFIWARTQVTNPGAATDAFFGAIPSYRITPFGYYASGDYQFARRWFVGGRYDRSAHANDSSAIDAGQSAVITYWPSEFSQARGQYRRTKYAVGEVANEFLFQLQFSIGAHGAHPF